MTRERLEEIERNVAHAFPGGISSPLGPSTPKVNLATAVPELVYALKLAWTENERLRRQL